MTVTNTTGDRLPRDFRRLWRSSTVSQVGSAIGGGAIPLLAILVLDSSNVQVSLLASISGIASAAIALPIGPFVEFHRKLPIMTAANLLAFASLFTIPVAGWLGVLSFAQLCAVVTVQTVCAIAISSASHAYIKAIVPRAQRVTAMGRLETMFQLVAVAGAPVGGAIITAIGPTITVLVDAISYLFAAGVLRAIPTERTPPPQRPPDHHWALVIRSGWSYIARSPMLRLLLANAALFGGSIMMFTPLLAILMLRELHFTPWQYGLALGLPGAGGVLGSVIAGRVTAAFGDRKSLLVLGGLRALWLGPVLFAGPDGRGLLLIIGSVTVLMFFAGAFNPVFVTERMNCTADDYMARVTTAWSITSKWIQPLFAAAGGVIASAAGVRVAIGCSAVLLILSAALLPWRATHRKDTLA
ncbi:MFS transporter [Nocardia sp. NPDC003482]